MKSDIQARNEIIKKIGIKNVPNKNEIQNLYKDKYDNLKERFDQLNEDHSNLKIAVEKLIGSDT